MSFSAPKRKTAYWHDHIGVCCLLRANELTSLDAYTVAALRLRKGSQTAYEINMREVYLLPMDRGTDLIEIPSAYFIGREDIENIAARTSLTDMSAEVFTVINPYFVLTDASLIAVEQMKQRQKLPNYSTRDTSDVYATAVHFKESTDDLLANLKQLHDQAAEGLKTDSDGIEGEVDRLLESLGSFLDASAKARKRNLE